MTNIFDIIPQPLFRPLAAQGASVYVDVLLQLFTETQQHQRPISRDLAITIIATLLNNPLAMAVTADAITANSSEMPDDSPETPDDTTARASAILRYLTQCGWLRIETQSDLTLAYTLPMYSFRLLNVLQEIAANKPLRLQGLICAIHDLLQAAVKEGADIFRFQEAYEQTRFLVTSLKELQHNIGVHIQEVLAKQQARDAMEHMFHLYRKQIVDQVYHQLRTTDHVSRFRPAVLNALSTLRQEERLQAMARHMLIRGETKSINEIAMLLSGQLQHIQDQFESLDQLLVTIDVRHSQFVDSAIRNVEYHLMATSTTSGQLHTILEYLVNQTPDPEAYTFGEEFASLVDLFSLELVDQESLASPKRAAEAFVPQVHETLPLSAEELAEAEKATLQQLTRAVNRTRVQMYAQALLGERDEIQAMDIPLNGATDLPLLIYLRAYGDGSLGYRVDDETTEDNWIEREGIGLRNFILRRV